jgi:hypothetical protein
MRRLTPSRRARTARRVKAMQMTQPKSIEDAIAKMYQDPNNNCIICGHKSDLVGAFMTEDSAYLVPDGKSRLLFYHICSVCKGSEGIEQLVEELLKRRINHNSN